MQLFDERLLHALEETELAQLAQHLLAERALRGIVGLLHDVLPARPRPHQIKARDLVSEPARETIASADIHAVDRPEHRPDCLRHLGRERRDDFTQILNDDVIQHRSEGWLRQRQELGEEGLGDHELTLLGLVRGKRKRCQLFSHRNCCRTAITRLKRPNRVDDVLFRNEAFARAPRVGVAGSLCAARFQNSAREKS